MRWWDKGERKRWGTARNEGTGIWMKKRSGETTNAEIAHVPTRRSIAIRVNATPSRDPEPEIFVAEADRQTRDPWDLTDDEKRQVLVCSRKHRLTLSRLSFDFLAVSSSFAFFCNVTAAAPQRILRIGWTTAVAQENSTKMSTSRYRRLNSCDYYFVIFTR